MVQYIIHVQDSDVFVRNLEAALITLASASLLISLIWSSLGVGWPDQAWTLGEWFASQWERDCSISYRKGRSRVNWKAYMF